MKEYELVWKQRLPRRLPLIIRVDGRAFHSYLKNNIKPFDHQFVKDMGFVAKALCEQIQGAQLAYHQSDEISIVVQDYQNEHSQPWFGGELQKIVSLSAAIATSELQSRRDGRPLFDSRAFVLPNMQEVYNYLLWRQRDAVKNSVSMAAYAHFSHKDLIDVTTEGRQEMLFTQRGINWNDYPAEYKRGQVAVKKSGEKEVTFQLHGVKHTAVAERSWWDVEAAPHFIPESIDELLT
jgi:tRNA(His) guanylyltransferase